MIFLSRSGSTLLARSLAEATSELIVLPEIDLLSILVARGDDSVRRMDSKQLTNLLSLDRQLSNLRLSDEQLASVARESEGKGIKHLVERLAHAFAGERGDGAEALVIKKGNLVRIHAPLAEIFGPVRYLHIYRDPRGVLNSMMRTKRAHFPSESMGRGDPLHAARRYVKLARQAEALQRNGAQVTEVRYEALCEDPAAVIRSTLLELGVGPGSGEPGSFEVGPEERALHPLVESAPKIERTTAWRSDLKRWQGLVIESVTEPVMRQRGYEPFFTPGASPAVRLLAHVRAHIQHLVQSTLFIGRRARFYAAHRQLLANRIRFRLLARRRGN